MSSLVQRRDNQLDLEKAPFITDTHQADQTQVNDDDDDKKYRRLKLEATTQTIQLALFVLFCIAFVAFYFPGFPSPSPEPLPSFVNEGIKKCEYIKRSPPSFEHATADRKKSDRYAPGTRPVYLKNATLWTGEDDGKQVLHGAGVWLQDGVIRRIGKDKKDFESLISDAGKDKFDEVELHGAWVTPGIVDVHSHLAVDASPNLEGSSDTNSWKNPILPFLRSLDAFNTHDAAFNLSISGGITTMLVLPGSAGNIGGQAFTFKPRTTTENTPQSMQVEPPFVISNKGKGSWERTKAWRHIKHACGENPRRVYGNTRLDSAWDFRKAYNEGKKLKERQERWCESPKKQTEPFPEDLEWEVVADIIRGNVKVNIHCYETVDLNDMVRISNEFEFPIAAFHHAHEAYLVPDVIKQAWGPETPGVAIFANNARYKREAYRGTHFAAKILDDANMTVVMKSDHPVLDSRHLVYEAAQAHAFGLEWNHALAAVTTRSAKLLGLNHRLGHIRPGYDADLVVWDSFPLSIGATPQQTYIDGIAQIINPHVTPKPAAAQKVSPAGKYDKEIAAVLQARGDPDLRPKSSAKAVIFESVKTLYLPGFQTQDEPGRVVVQDGKITCTGSHCVSLDGEHEIINLNGGSLAPGLITTGSHLGLIEIAQEPMTSDGEAYDPLENNSELLQGLLVHGVDGAQFEGKDQLLAYREGVTTGVTPPIVYSGKLIAGLSYQFSTSATHALAKDAIGNKAAALYLSIDEETHSRSTKIAVLRRLLTSEAGKNDLHSAFTRAAAGELRLVIKANDADVISSLVRLKRDHAPKLQLTILGGTESWLLAHELAEENIGVIVSPPRSFPGSWDQRRIIPGPPLSNHTLVSFLASNGVTVGLGITEECDARLTRFDAAWEYVSAPEVFSPKEAIDLVSGNLEVLLGLKGADTGFVAYEGDFFSLQSRVRAVRAPGAEVMDLF